MGIHAIRSRLRFLLNRIGEKLWVKPLIMCLGAIGGTFVARGADYAGLGEIAPDITVDSVNTLLTIMSASMLVIATFSVASMVSAYSSASGTATPRSFSLIIADDVSQNALSAFLGAFIFSIVSLIALENSYYERAGRFTLFALTLGVFVIVIATFIRWVDSIARLGRLGNTIDRVEMATASALKRRKNSPTLGGVPVTPRQTTAIPVFTNSVGYVQRVDIHTLNVFAEESEIRIEVSALPGDFAAPGYELAFIRENRGNSEKLDLSRIRQAFTIGHDRTYDDDVRFGFVALSEIASRALSPGINDPGTAIDVIGTLVRLFASGNESVQNEEGESNKFNRVEVPELRVRDMFDDAFRAIARDGAGTIEVVVRLQEAFRSLASIDDPEIRDAALHHARLTFARAEKALEFPQDIKVARKASEFAETP